MKDIIKKVLHENYLHDKSDKNYKHLLGKRVCIKYPRKHKNIEEPKGKGYTEFSDDICGILSFIGYNENVKAYQATIGRTPVWPIKPKNIRVIDEEPNS